MTSPVDGRALTDDEMERLAAKVAKRAVDEALQRMYVEIGRNVLKKAAYIIGVGVIALGLWLSGVGPR